MGEQGTRWGSGHGEYVCADGTRVSCKPKMVYAPYTRTPWNGLWQRRGEPLVLAVAGVQLNRNATAISRESGVPVYTFPRTVRKIGDYAFESGSMVLPVLSEDETRIMEAYIDRAALRRIVLPSSVSAVGESAF